MDKHSDITHGLQVELITFHLQGRLHQEKAYIDEPEQ